MKERRWGGLPGGGPVADLASSAGAEGGRVDPLLGGTRRTAAAIQIVKPDCLGSQGPAKTHRNK